jgi:hypothetical protein
MYQPYGTVSNYVHLLQLVQYNPVSDMYKAYVYFDRALSV